MSALRKQPSPVSPERGFFVGDYMASGKRRPGETYKQYKKRLQDQDQGLKRPKKGRVVWNHGTLRRADFISHDQSEDDY
jgi:hypothetical protein